MENEIALEPQLQRQYQWSPFSPVDGGDPEGQPQEGEQGVENG